MQVHDTIQREVSDIFHKYIHDLDGSEPDDLVQVVYDALNDFVTDMPVVTVRIVVTDHGLVSSGTFQSN